MNTLAKAIGFRWFEKRQQRGDFELRLSWAEITGGLGFALALCLFEEHYSLHIRLGWPNFYITLPMLQRWHREPHEMMESWGFSWYWDCIHLNWGRHCKLVHLPWAWEWVRTSYLMKDGKTWLHELRSFRKYDTPPATKTNDWFYHRDLPLWKQTHKYTYVTKRGELQFADATIGVEEREWRWRWFTWLPFPRMIHRTIDVQFSDEIGERKGSWKGGCTGCGYDLRYDETPWDCLRRMERERKF